MTRWIANVHCGSRSAVLAIALLAGLACNPSSSGLVCTEIGCNSGLTINVPAAATLPYTLTLQATNAQTLIIQCSTSFCAHSVFATDYTPVHVTATVQWQGGSAVKEFSPEYKLTRPNGPGCEPECKQATVTF